jgi:pyruvate kinase
VLCEVVDGGELKSRRHLNVRGKSATLPSITEKDWEDIKFGVDNKVDYYALSFVKDAEVVHELKDFLKDRGADIHVIVKIESADSIPNLQSILDAADGVGVPVVWSKLLLQHVLSNQLIVQSFKFPVLQGDLLGVVNLMQLFV